MKKITLLIFISLLINGVFGDEVKSVSVMEGDSVTLHPNYADMQAKNLILTWTFGGNKTRIAQINRAAKETLTYADVLDGKFGDRLHLDSQTGDLTITNITTQHTGPYDVRIIAGSKNEKQSFNVNSVSNPESDQLKSVSVKDGDSVTLLADDRDIKKYDVIQWRFKGIRIAHFNKSASEISEDVRFRGKLQLDVQTGSLKIKNIRMDLPGLYQVDLTTTSSSYTIHQPFTVTVSETYPYSKADYQRTTKGEVKSVSAINGDPLTINTDVPDIKTYDQILLIFGCDDKLIAEVNKQNKQFTLYGEDRDRLQVNDQTGDLTITDIRYEDTGLYELKMSSRRRTIQRRFSVYVSERGLSPGAIAGIAVGICIGIPVIIFLLIAAATIYFHFKDTRLDLDEGESVLLKTKVPDIQTDDLIEWRFNPGEPTGHIWQMLIVAIKRVLGFSRLNETLIAEINPANNIFRTSNDDLFRDKLNLNNQTGDLTINDIRQKHTGVYKLKIIRDGKTTEKRFRLSVRDSMLEVDEGKSVNLKTEVKDKEKVDLIEWRFKETLIAEINPANNIFNTYDGDDDEFRDKLKLNRQTGDLNINDIRWKHDGVYKLKIIRDGETSDRRFSVSVKCEIKILEVDEGNSADLKTKVKDIQRDDLIEWRFGETLIAEINPANNIFRTYNDDLFRGKLKLNHQTGDLTISDIRWENTGVYKLKIIRGGKTSYKTISVSVRGETKTLEVNEGESVDLETEVTDIKKDDVIEWRFKETLIAEINPANNIFSTYDGDDDLFKDKLKLNRQTGDLTINDFKREHTGVYKLKIIRDGETSYKRFRLFIICTTKTLRVNEGESVDLKTEVTDIKRVDLIEWRFGETLIAEINPANNIFSTYDGAFRDKLNLNHLTGDLNINDFKWERDGVYTLRIIRGGKTSYRRFFVFVTGETKILEVDEGKSADLKTEVKDIKKDDLIEWRFRGTPIAEINPVNNIFSTYDGGYDLFKGKLNLNHQTGDLNIKDIRQKHTGVYKLKIIRDGETSYKTISVFVRGDVETLRVDEWKFVNLKTEVKDIQTVDLTEWRFKETLIANINPALNIFRKSNDDLFRDKLKLNPQTGDLNINYIRWEHTGDYTLKIIKGEEVSYRRFRVHVRDKMEPLSVNEGESFNLETKDMQGYDVIEWRFGETLIAKINPKNKLFNTYDDDDLFGGKLTLNHETGDLTISDIREKHSGVYKLRRIKYGVPPYPQRYFVLVKAGGDSERKRGQHSEEKRGKDLEQKKGKNSVRKRGDSVEIEMPLLPNSSQ